MVYIFPILIAVLVSIVVVFIVITQVTKYRHNKNLKAVDTAAFEKFDFDMNFEFECEYCKSIIKSSDPTCPSCGSDYGKNKEYRNKKIEKNREYIDILKRQNAALDTEIDNIQHNRKSLKENFIFTNTQFNMKVDKEHNRFVHSVNFEFNCEYCGTKINGTSKDEKKCPHCGASYNENLELLTLEEKEKVEYDNYVKYNKLQFQKEDQNIENQIRDNHIVKISTNTSKVIVTIIGIILAVAALLFIMVMTNMNS